MSNRYEDYLGDGLYASFDGYQIFLRANGCDFDQGATDQVALEPSVVRAFFRYVDRLRREGIDI